MLIEALYWCRILILGVIGSLIWGMACLFLGASVLTLALAPLLAPGADSPWSVFLVLCGVVIYTVVGLAIDEAGRRDDTHEG